MIITGVGVLCFGLIPNFGSWLLVPFIVLFGFCYAGYASVIAAIIRRTFGRVNFGTIFGFIMGLGYVGVVIGPILGGLVFDTWNNYQYLWLAYFGLSLFGALSILTAPEIIDRKSGISID